MSASERLKARLAALRAAKAGGDSTQPEGLPREQDKVPVPAPAPAPTAPEPSVVQLTGDEPASEVQFKNYLLKLEEQLNERVSDFPYLLRDIHKHLRQDPAIQTVLTDEEIGLVIKGFKAQKNTLLGAPVKGARKRATTRITSDML